MTDTEHHCPDCGASVERDWQFCRTCGFRQPTEAIATRPATPGPGLVPRAPAPTPVPAAPEPVEAGVEVVESVDGVPAGGDDTPPPRRRWVRRHLGLVGAAVLAAASVVAAGVWIDSLRGDLRTTRTELATTTEELEATADELSATEEALGARTSERDRARDLAATRGEEISGLESELQGVRSSLGSAREQLNLQRGQIATLKSCLQGVTNALIYLADGYYEAALGALQSVEVACNSASELF